MTVSLRRATLDDSRFVWEINNDPSVRAQSISRDFIPWAGHERWFAARVASMSTLLFIAMNEDRDVGVVRFDVAGDEATISVALAPTEHGKGFGRAAIASATDELARAFPSARAVALVRPENMASVRAFEHAGYVRRGTSHTADVELLRFER